MKKLFITIAIFLFIAVSTINAQAGLNDFLSDLNAQAKSDIKKFNEKLSSQFDLPLQKVKDIIKKVEFPGDAFMCMQLGLMTNNPPETIVHVYREKKKKGWGAIAKDLGIKPGSDEFHALKSGDFAFNGIHKKKIGDNKGTGKGKGKGKNKKK
ncbi:MAG: hypothetical protein KAJ62_04765 [Desulfobacteraceae bacterium]|nr:hypothetical protein [Desulfobacteraceae bacterium]